MTPLKIFMLKHGLTIPDLCLVTGASHRMVGYWRSGHWPPPRWLQIFMAAMDDELITPAWLLTHLRSMELHDEHRVDEGRG